MCEKSYTRHAYSCVSLRRMQYHGGKRSCYGLLSAATTRPTKKPSQRPSIVAAARAPLLLPGPRVFACGTVDRRCRALTSPPPTTRPPHRISPAGLPGETGRAGRRGRCVRCTTWAGGRKREGGPRRSKPHENNYTTPLLRSSTTPAARRHGTRIRASPSPAFDGVRDGRWTLVFWT